MSSKRKEQKVEFTIAGAAQETEPVITAQPVKPRISFSTWWLQIQQAKKLKPELREALKKHFQARGFMDSGEFDKGIVDFGL